MKITVLDGYALNPGDLSWEGFERFGDVIVCDRTPENRILERCAGRKVILTNKTPLTATTIEALPGLKYIGLLATGYNVVDVSTAAKKGIVVTNIPTYGTYSVAQMVFALLLELCHHVQYHSDSVKRGEWSSNKDWCYWRYPLIELSGKTMGIIGFGRIGRQVGKIADGMGMDVLAFDVKEEKEATENAGYIFTSDIDRLFRVSDVISLNCPLVPETEGIINVHTIGLMKPTAFVINASRGPLVNENDLADALNEGRIAGAGLDVLTMEPPGPHNPLLSAKNCLITPHIAWATKEARKRLMDIAVENLRAFISGSPVNTVV